MPAQNPGHGLSFPVRQALKPPTRARLLVSWGREEAEEKPGKIYEKPTKTKERWKKRSKTSSCFFFFSFFLGDLWGRRAEIGGFLKYRFVFVFFFRAYEILRELWRCDLLLLGFEHWIWVEAWYLVRFWGFWSKWFFFNYKIFNLCSSVLVIIWIWIKVN